MIEKFIRLSRSLYLLRVPLAALCIFPFFAFLALGPLESLLGNLLKGLDAVDCGTLGYTSYLAAIAAGFAGWVIEMRAPERLGIPVPALPEVGSGFRILAPLAPLAILVPALVYSTSPWLAALGAILVGAFLAFLQALLALAIYYLLPRRLVIGQASRGALLSASGLPATAAMLQHTAPAPQVPGAPIPDLVSWMRIRLNRGRLELERQLSNLDSPFYKIPPLLLVSLVLLALSLMRRLILAFTGWLGPGYFKDAQARQRGEPYPEHVLSLSFFLLVFLGYLVTGYLKIRHMGEITEFSTAGYLCITLTLLTTTLSGVTFALDRWMGVATILTLLVGVLLILIPAAGITDHYFEVVSVDPGPAPPARIRLPPGSSRIIVITAAGGGIQAAAWTAAVLAGLDQQIPAFRSSLNAVSGVSGGSVGLMFYLASFPGPSLREGGREAILNRALASSLDELAAGLTYLDVLRVPLSPWRWARLLDRGRALELTFAKRAGLEGVLLSDWAKATSDGLLPTVIFNAVEVETGRPVLFATTRIEPPLEDVGSRSEGSNLPFREGPAGIGVATAVRLSASFPFATPVSRPLYPSGDAATPASSSPPARIHLADGGYYDNYGVTSMAHWLNDALGHTQAPPTDVLFLQIRSFPPEPRSFQLRSLLFQLTAPLTTLLSVREEAQRIRNQEYLRVLQGYWERSNPVVHIHLMQADYRPRESSSCFGSQPPLSWRLRADQQQCILQVWEESRADTVEQVEEFLEPGEE